MACSTCSSTCACAVQAADTSITVTGIGSAANPYQVSANTCTSLKAISTTGRAINFATDKVVAINGSNNCELITITQGTNGSPGAQGPTGPTGAASTTPGVTAPTSPSTGQQWFDTTTNKARLKIYTGSSWRIVGGDMPHFELRNAATWTNDGTNPSCPSWDTADFDYSAFLAISGNAYVTVPAGLGGIYEISYSVTANSDTTGYSRSAWIDVNVAAGSFPTNGTGRRYALSAVNPDAGTGAITLTGTAIIKVAAGDVIRVKTWQNSAATKTWGVAASRQDLNHFSGIMIVHLP